MLKRPDQLSKNKNPNQIPLAKSRPFLPKVPSANSRPVIAPQSKPPAATFEVSRPQTNLNIPPGAKMEAVRPTTTASAAFHTPNMSHEAKSVYVS